ncbi:MAG: hypothetical protein GAK43_01620 [Stenotrophomonas maltophilia]|nr:MAG: hypothetical protein GAK43_01620 [Stenotrophomonas maltophilia]
MDFILYSDIDERSIQSSLGLPEYSYYFVLEAYRDALQDIGNVHSVQSTEQILELHRSLADQGRECVALIFAPPHKAPVDLPCRTLCVIAWEYDSIPDTAWDDEPRNDWRYVLARHGAAITLSSHTAQAVRAAMGTDFPVLVLPTPLWERYEELRQQAAQPVCATTQLQIRGCILDTRLLGLSADGLIVPILEEPEPAPVEDIVVEHAPPPLTPARRWLISKHYLRQWYREAVSDLVPSSLRKLLRQLRPRPVEAPPMAAIQQPPAVEVVIDAEPEHPQAALPDITQVVSTDISGVVYTSVFNPLDGRKNWEHIVTAFCWALRDTEDATLILKITQNDLARYYLHILTLLSQLAPFRCRVLVLHGYLDSEQYARLHQVTSFYVNASRCEGLCLPLMEFLCCGKPVIAPAHTAMADYIDDSLALVIPSSLEHSVWPHDTRRLYRTHRHRPDWGALRRAYQESHRIATQAPGRYAQLSGQALTRMSDYAARPRFQRQLMAFLATRQSAAMEMEEPVEAGTR